MRCAQNMVLLILCLVVTRFFLFHALIIDPTSAANVLTYNRRLSDNVLNQRLGFISIDCGSNESYIDESTNLYYTTDEDYTDTGKNMKVTQGITTNTKKLWNSVRSFPNGDRNCYSITGTLGKGSRYIVRAYFWYGNYDGLNSPPTFELHLGTDVWKQVQLTRYSKIYEMIHTLSADILDVCLVNIHSGTPFITALELRPLPISYYGNQTFSIELLQRGYMCRTGVICANGDPSKRYGDDIYDRIWSATNFPPTPTISTTQEINTRNGFEVPVSVLRTALEPARVSTPIHLGPYDADSSNPNTEYWYYLHFVELSNLGRNETREIDVFANGVKRDNNFTPSYLTIDTIHTLRPIVAPILDIYMQSTNRSTLPPFLNAFEIFWTRNLDQRSTDQLDVDAIRKIKATYEMTQNWQGDPCLPFAYVWNGVKCRGDFSTSSVRIISLYLNSTKLSGSVAPSFANLTALEVLDLSDNNLSGEIPAFLADLPFLKTLNLSGNNFTGAVPQQLLARSSSQSLSLSVDRNPGLCLNTSCIPKKQRPTFIIPLATGAGVIVLVMVGFIIFCLICKKRPRRSFVRQKEQSRSSHGKRKGGLTNFSYSELEEITSGFQKEVGRGGFAVVYCGRLKDGNEVAVKMLSPSVNASEGFSTEVQLLIAIRHKNLVSLVGYCEEGTHFALIYEYMSKGNLRTLLESSSLSWKERLHIAIDAAQGLDYLHNGCRPPIVHRDVKTANILLNESLQAKLADFGLSKIFPDEFRSHVSTRVIGTVGYLDPQYREKQQLNDKCDVYSFGVVLLELITGRAAMLRNDNGELTSLVQWVRPSIERGEVRSILDAKLTEVEDTNSVWRAIDIALACTASTERPTMSQIVAELKECLAMVVQAANLRPHLDGSIEMAPMISTIEMTPEAR